MTVSKRSPEPAFPFLHLVILVCLVCVPAAGARGSSNFTQAVQDAADLPSPSAIIDRYLEAIGGADRIRARTSSHVVGEVTMPELGFTGTMEMFAAAPDKMLLTVDIEGLGPTMTGFDGETGWATHPLIGPRVLSGKELDQVRDEADFYGALHDPDSFELMETISRTEFGDEDCYALRLVRKSGIESIEYFAVETGLLRGLQSTQESVMGSQGVTTYLSEYREFGGQLVPTVMIQEAEAAGAVRITVISIEYDSVPDTVFELPAEIKALVGGQQ